MRDESIDRYLEYTSLRNGPAAARRSRPARRRCAIVLAALSVCMGGVIHARANPPPSAPGMQSPSARFDVGVRHEVAEKFAAMLDTSYAHADIGTRMATAVRAKLRSGAYDAIDSPDEFARALQDTAHTIEDDRHLRVIYGLPPMRRMEGRAPSREMIAEMRKENGAVVAAKILDGNIGYMIVNGVPNLEFSKGAIASAFAFLHNTDALIIDLRGNGGGEPSTVAFYMSYLSEGAPRVINAIHWRRGDRVEAFKTVDLGALSYGATKPVLVLTSHWTFSGGEELAYDIQSFKRGLVVGETTGGGANPGGFQPLGHGFQVFLPVGYAVNPVTHTNWEGRGIQPNVPTPAGQALVRAELLAVADLKRIVTGPPQAAPLDAAQLEFEAAAEYTGGHVSPPPHARIVGRYSQAGSAGGLTIAEENGALYLEVAGRPDTRLVPAGPGHYRLDGLPDVFGMTFMEKHAAVTLVMNQPGRGLSVLRKQ